MNESLEQSATMEGRSGERSGRAGTFGMLLFLAALGMLFLAMLLAYVVVRTQLINPDRQAYPPLGELTLPMGLWLSTFAILLSSISLQFALMAVRAGRLSACRNAMIGTAALVILFLAIQGPCLRELLLRHADAIQKDIYSYAMMAMLVIVHAAHVIGGVIALLVITRRVAVGRYSADSYGPVKYITMYWHFVDAVWLIMFNVMLLLG